MYRNFLLFRRLWFCWMARLPSCPIGGNPGWGRPGLEAGKFGLVGDERLMASDAMVSLGASADIVVWMEGGWAPLRRPGGGPLDEFGRHSNRAATGSQQVGIDRRGYAGYGSVRLFRYKGFHPESPFRHSRSRRIVPFGTAGCRLSGWSYRPAGAMTEKISRAGPKRWRCYLVLLAESAVGKGSPSRVGMSAST
jgi:hypothetical protein